MRGQKRGCKAHPPLPVVLTHLIWIRRVPVTAPGMSHQLVERKPGERVCIYPHKSNLEINYDTAKSEVPGTAYISSWIPTRCKGHCTYFLILGTGCNHPYYHQFQKCWPGFTSDGMTPKAWTHSSVI